MAAKRKRTQVSKTASRKLEGVSDLLSKLEVEAEKIVRRLVEKAEQSSRDLKKGITTVIEQVRPLRFDGIASLANDKKEEIVRIAEDVLAKAKEIQFLPSAFVNRDEIIRDARRNLEEIVAKISTSDIFARAKVTANNTKDQVLSILSIPSHSEVVRLSRKITTLESRVSKLTKKAA